MPNPTADNKAQVETPRKSFERLHCQIFWSAEDAEYVFTCDEFPCFSVLDETIPRLLYEASEALPMLIELWEAEYDVPIIER